MAHHHAVAPLLQPALGSTYKLDSTTPGSLGSLASKIIHNFDLVLDQSSPKLFEMFKERNRTNNGAYQTLLPWSGEFAGKYLTHCVQLFRLTGDAELKTQIIKSFQLLQEYQAENGYMGPWNEGFEFGVNHWEAWGHYHTILASLLWYQVEQDQGILEFAAKMGDLLVEQLGGDPKKLYALQAWEENDAILHGMALLYSTTGKKAYLDFCNVILLEFQMPPCGDYVRNALAGKQYYEGSQPRWEGLHAVLGIAEMAWITGD
eukprot:gene22688-13427_t